MIRFANDRGFVTIERMSHSTLSYTAAKAQTLPRIVSASPFLKWAGGKGRILPQLLQHFPKDVHNRRYYEPFVGGGAVFFALQPRQSHLFDLNPDLVEAYCVVRDRVEELIAALGAHSNDPGHFYHVRAQDTSTLSPVERAARLLYLNRTCFNGLYRVNRRGEFNVPFGKYANPTICNVEGLRASSRALQGVTIEHADFAEATHCARAGDFVYFDPPYVPLSPTSSFTAYYSHKFGEEEHKRLARTFAALAERGVTVALSNSDTPLVRMLYADFTIASIVARRNINSKADRRGAVREVLIVS